MAGQKLGLDDPRGSEHVCTWRLGTECTVNVRVPHSMYYGDPGNQTTGYVPLLPIPMRPSRQYKKYIVHLHRVTYMYTCIQVAKYLTKCPGREPEKENQIHQPHRQRHGDTVFFQQM